MRVAVVIPALDEAHRIAESVRGAREPGVEVVVSDGGSERGTLSSLLRNALALAGGRLGIDARRVTAWYRR